MSDITATEKRILEPLFRMESGYVLSFSNRSFSDFLLDSVAISPDDARFNEGVGSKANRLRAIWRDQPNHVVAKLIADLTDVALEVDSSPANLALAEKARGIEKRLASGSPAAAFQSLSTIVSETFDAHLTAVRASLEQGRPEEGVDRLHTFCVGYLRRTCDSLGLPNAKKEPLSSLLGKLLKHLKANGSIKSEMTERILKSNITNLEAFDYVRNSQSLAHDNTLLSKPEAELIVGHIAVLMRFMESVLPRSKAAGPSPSLPAAD